jgi:hypothetical protein
LTASFAASVSNPAGVSFSLWSRAFCVQTNFYPKAGDQVKKIALLIDITPQNGMVIKMATGAVKNAGSSGPSQRPLFSPPGLRRIEAENRTGRIRAQPATSMKAFMSRKERFESK